MVGGEAEEGRAINKIDKLQFKLITDVQGERSIAGPGDKAVIKAFKSSKGFEELQIDFARSVFKIGKLHVCCIIVASGVKLGGLVK